LAFTGLRASEFRGLRWKDVDLKACELRVSQRADEYNVIGEPKSRSSVPTIPLDPVQMAPVLKTWKMQCTPTPHDDFVFPTRTGKPMDYNSIRDGSIDPVMIAAGVTKPVLDSRGEPKHDKNEERLVQPKYTPHAFRHFFASWCINPKARGGRELPPKQVQTLLGHSSIVMTLDIYGHLFPRGNDSGELAAASRALFA